MPWAKQKKDSKRIFGGFKIRLCPIGNGIMTNNDKYMQLAIELARRGRGRVSPNPLVGAVLVKNGRIVGRGYHAYLGGEHAEIAALKKAGKNSRGATLFVNLEPCVHYGRTPPCVPEIIKAGIQKTVIGMIDPNQINSGRGIKALQEAGIEVCLGVKENECRELNKDFINSIVKNGSLQK